MQHVQIFLNAKNDGFGTHKIGEKRYSLCTEIPQCVAVCFHRFTNTIQTTGPQRDRSGIPYYKKAVPD